MGLLIIYHIAVSFQPWAGKIYFIQNDQPLEGLWIIMSMFNVWRIPILFMISGMGVCFAMEHRGWKQLLKERTIRILVPFVFGFFFICPINIYILMKYYGEDAVYIPNAGHLWFLANIFLYVLLLLPLLVYLKNRPNNIVFRFLSKVSRMPLGLLVFSLPLMVEAWLMNPDIFTLYVMTPHGFLLGMICFFTGFIFVALKDVFWQAVARAGRISLAVALVFYIVRLMVFQLKGEPNILIAFESMSWMLAILGYGSLYLNKSSAGLLYLGKAVYPVYIIHLPVQYWISYYLLPLPLPAMLKLCLLLAGTLGLCLLIYEYVISRLKWIRPLLGMKLSYG